MTELEQIEKFIENGGIEAAQAVINHALDVVETLGPDAINALENISVRALQTIEKIGPELIKTGGEVANNAIYAVQDISKSVSHTIETIGTTAIHTHGEVAKTAINSMKEITNTTIKSVENVTSNAIDVGGEVAKTSITAFKDISIGFIENHKEIRLKAIDRGVDVKIIDATERTISKVLDITPYGFLNNAVNQMFDVLKSKERPAIQNSKKPIFGGKGILERFNNDGLREEEYEKIFLIKSQLLDVKEKYPSVASYINFLDKAVETKDRSVVAFSIQFVQEELQNPSFFLC